MQVIIKWLPFLIWQKCNYLDVRPGDPTGPDIFLIHTYRHPHGGAAAIKMTDIPGLPHNFLTFLFTGSTARFIICCNHILF
jgi:hypothetical protein